MDKVFKDIYDGNSYFNDLVLLKKTINNILTTDLTRVFSMTAHSPMLHLNK